MKVSAKFDDETRAVMDLTTPVQFIANVVQLIARAVQFTPHVFVVPMVIVQLVVDVLEAGPGAGEFVVNVMTGAMVAGFIFEMALPLPQTVEIGMAFIVPMVSPGARCERNEASGNG